MDTLYQQELATADAGVRQGIFEQIHQIYLAQFPFIPLLSPSTFAIVHIGIYHRIGFRAYCTISRYHRWAPGGLLSEHNHT